MTLDRPMQGEAKWGKSGHKWTEGVDHSNRRFRPLFVLHEDTMSGRTLQQLWTALERGRKRAEVDMPCGRNRMHRPGNNQLAGIYGRMHQAHNLLSETCWRATTTYDLELVRCTDGHVRCSLVHGMAWPASPCVDRSPDWLTNTVTRTLQYKLATITHRDS
jgi:hypothetical protein